MGKLIEGEWVQGSVISSDKKGSFDREPRTFRDFISSSHELYKPESGRYHLYVSYACPWATRTLIYRNLKGLANHITVSYVHPDMRGEGWEFDESYKGATVDHINGFNYLREVYLKADSKVTTSVSVPILWDKKTNSIVNNESSEIIRMFNSSFNELTANTIDYYPEEKRVEIDRLNGLIYDGINNGVYKTGFAKTQDAYDEAVALLFDTLDEMESLLEDRKYLTGDEITEADLRLIPTLLRFDIVYVTHFKCNVRQIKEYKNLSRYTKALYEDPAIKEATNLDHIKRHYYYSHESVNPYRIIPKGPDKIF
jgi:glutathionyl-hydroquinone reductase